MASPRFGRSRTPGRDHSQATASKPVQVTPTALLLLLWTEAGELKLRFP
jgi:hypothetical protein